MEKRIKVLLGGMGGKHMEKVKRDLTSEVHCRSLKLESWFDGKKESYFIRWERRKANSIGEMRSNE